MQKEATYGHLGQSLVSVRQSNRNTWEGPAGFIMSHRGSNLERIDWAIELLKLKSDDRVLEIGFGPGIAIEKMETIASNGLVYGLDHSTLMYRQASSRNRKAIAAGTIRLFLGSVADIPKFEFQFDKVLDINSFQFWDEPVDRLRQLKKNIKKTGTLVLVHQPRNPKATDDSANETAKDLSLLLKEAGFSDVIIEKHQR